MSGRPSTASARVGVVVGTAAALVAAVLAAASLTPGDAGATGSGPGVYSWGATTNWHGQTGNGQGGGSTGPYPVLGMAPTSDAVAIAAGGNHSLTLSSSGAVSSFGSNAFGELGIGSTTKKDSPQAVTGLGSSVIAIAAGASHSLALTDNGTVYAWGNNDKGQLGIGSTAQRTQPTVVQGLGSGSGVVAIAAGYQHSLAVRDDGTVLAWGYNHEGELGDGTTLDRSVPTPVPGLGAGSGVVEVAAGLWHSLGRTADGRVWAWGDGESGQLGDGLDSVLDPPNHHVLAPVQALGLTAAGGATKIDGGSNYSGAIGADGSVLMWGMGALGRRCDGNTANAVVPTVVPAFGPGTGITDLALGWQNTIITRADGATFGCGYNQDNVLGNGNGGVGPDGAKYELLPSPVIGLGAGSGTTDVDTGYAHSLAIAAAPSAAGTVVTTTTSTTTTTTTTTTTATTSLPAGPSTVTVGDVTIVEGDAGTRTAYVPLTLDRPSAVDVVVTLRTRADATNTGDYRNLSLRTVKLPAGVVSKTVALSVYGDIAADADSNAIVDLVSVTNAVAGDVEGAVLIGGDDPPDTGIVVAVSDVTLNEGDAGGFVATFTLSLNGPAGSDVKVGFKTTPFTASAGADYKSKTGTVTFLAGQVSKPVKVTLLADPAPEADEAFLLALTNPVGVTIWDDIGVAIVRNDD